MRISRTLALLLALSLTIAACGSEEGAEAEAEATAEAETPAIDEDDGTDEEPDTDEGEEAESTIDIAALDPVVTPDGMRRLKSADGDLDKDGTPERVVVFETDKQTDMGLERELRIYRATESGWDLWHSSVGAVMPSDHGGAMGEPFHGLSVERGAIVIRHLGGSRAKWEYIHRYRFQNGAFHLIGTTSEAWNDCDTRHELDYNLMTGNADVKYSHTECDAAGNETDTPMIEERIARKLDRLPKMDGFEPGAHAIEQGGERFCY